MLQNVYQLPVMGIFRDTRGAEGTAWCGMGMFFPPQADFFGGLPEGRYGKMLPFVYRGMGMGWERRKPLGQWDGTRLHDFLAGRDRGKDREYSREIGREHSN